MAKRTKFKALSRRARQLLQNGESQEVDYKEKIDGLHAEDLVAFANSELGGAVLIGVQEVDHKGSQKGVPIGCRVGDKFKLKILDKAQSCVPVVHVEIFLENTESKAFYRIEIPSGNQKPYATQKGIYKIRGDAKNNPILPEQMLEIFLRQEVDTFKERFSEATNILEQRIQKTYELIDGFSCETVEKMADISKALSWTQRQTEDTASIAEDIQSTLEDIKTEINEASSKTVRGEQRMLTLLKHLNVGDPVTEKAKEVILRVLLATIPRSDDFIYKLESDKQIIHQVPAFRSALFDVFIRTQYDKLDAEDFTELIDDALRYI